MKKNFHLIAILISCFFYLACGKHVYMASTKELSKLALEAREPVNGPFITYYNEADTLKGTDLKRKHNILNGRETWYMDGNEIPNKTVSTYQDKDGFYAWGGTIIRVYRGRVNLYGAQKDNSRVITTLNSSTKQFESHTQGYIETSFYLQKGSIWKNATFESLNELLSDYPPAVAQVKKEFPGKNHMYMGNDYRAFVRILKIYDQQ